MLASLPAGSCLSPLCLDTARTKIRAAWPVSSHRDAGGLYIAPRHTGGSRWDLRNTECYIAWCGEMGLADRWRLWEWALGLPGNRFFQAGLLGLQEVGFALLCSPRPSQALPRRRSRVHCGLSVGGAAPCRGSLPGLGGAESGRGLLEAHGDSVPRLQPGT